MKKLSENELLRLACIYAQLNQEEVMAAYEHMPGDREAKKAKSFVKQIREYRLKRWGRTKLEAILDNAKDTPLEVVAGRPNTKAPRKKLCKRWPKCKCIVRGEVKDCQS